MKKILIPFAIVFAIFILVWAFYGFPLNPSTISGVVIAAFMVVLAGIKLILDVTESLQKKIFSSKPQERLAKDLKQSTEPQPIPPSTQDPKEEKASSLGNLRSRSGIISSDDVKEYTKKILGEKTTYFWDQVKGPLFSSLIQDPFMLDGLILVFEQENEIFPKNPGKLLDLILKVQWNEKKLNQKNIPAVETVQFVLGRIANRHIRSEKYLLNSRSMDYGSVFEKDFGELPPPPKSWMQKRTISIYQRIQTSKKPTRYLLWMVLIIILSPMIVFQVAVYTLMLPFYLLEMVWMRFGSDFRRTNLGYALNSSVVSFFHKINFSERKMINRGKHLLNCAFNAHILEMSGNFIQFKNIYWRYYFVAAYIAFNDEYNDQLQELFSKYEIYQYPEKIDLALILCGLVKDPIKLIDELSQIDPVVAATCAVDGLASAQGSIPDKLKFKLIDALEQIIHKLDDCPPSYHYRAARLLPKLSNSPHYAKAILDEYSKYITYEHDYEISKIVAQFGPSALEMLVKRINTESESFYYEMVALGEIGDPRAIPALQKYLTDNDYKRRIMALIVLATYFNEPEAIDEINHYLFFERDNNPGDNKHRTSHDNYVPYNDEKGKFAWKNIDARGEKAIPIIINALWYGQLFVLKDREKTREDHYYWTSDSWRDMREQFIYKIGHDYQGKATVEGMLIDGLEKASDHDLKVTFIKVLNKIESKKAAERLFNMLLTLPLELKSTKQIAGDVRFIDQGELRNEIISILSHGIDNEFVLGHILGMLETDDALTVLTAIWTLAKPKNIKAVKPLIDKLKSDDIAILPIGTKYPISWAAMKALAIIGTQEAKRAAREWCKAHLDDKRVVGFEHGPRTIASEVDLELQTNLIDWSGIFPEEE